MKIERVFTKNMKDSEDIFSVLEWKNFDVSIKDQEMQMKSYGIQVQFTPTFIFGCEYFIGVKSKEEYLLLLDKYLEGGQHDG